MTRICFVFDEGLATHALVRHTVAVMAAALEWPSRLAPPGGAHAADELPVFVGRPERAPADSAAVIPYEDGEDWTPARVGLARFENEPLLVLPEMAVTTTDERALPGCWLRGIVFLITREEERLEPHRDEWECFGGFFSRLHALGVLERPLVQLYLRALERRVRLACERRGEGLPALARWKGGARFAVALGHDVDWVRRFSFSNAWRLVTQARSPGSYAFRHGLTVALDTARHVGAADPYASFERWIAEEDRFGFRSSFYFAAPGAGERHEYDPTYRPADRIPFEGRTVALESVMRALGERGFEVGLHGSYLSHRSAERLESQKRRIESAAGRKVIGTRQHFLRFDVRETWAAQDAAGFVYDSTLGFNELPGFRAGLAIPFHPWNAAAGAGHRLLELPLTVMDGALFRTLKLDRALAFRRVREQLEAVEDVGGLAVLLWHPNVTDTRSFPGWWDCYRETLAWLAGRSAWVTSGEHVAQWWLERERRAERGD